MNRGEQFSEYQIQDTNIRPINLDAKVEQLKTGRVLNLENISENLDKLKIDEKDKFLFQKAKINEDVQSVKNKKEWLEKQLRTDFDRETNQLSHGLEWYLIDQLPSILNDSVNTYPGIDYVDYFQGCDVILESKETGHFLSIDVTLGEKSSEKFNRIYLNLKDEKLGHARYFLNNNELKSLENIPQIVLGLDRKNFEETIPDWLENKSYKPEIKKILLEQAISQLRTYQIYLAQKLPNSDKVNSLEEFARLFESELKSEEIVKSQYKEDKVKDLVYSSLRENYIGDPESHIFAATPKKEVTGRVINLRKPLPKTKAA